MSKSGMKLKGLSGKFILLFLSVTAAAILIISVLSYLNIKSSILDIATDQLRSNLQIKVNSINSYFEHRKKEIEMVAGTRAAKTAMMGFQKAYVKGVNSKDFRDLENDIREVLLHNVKSFGHVDAYWITNQGTIIYSLKKRDDFGTNLENGKYQDSRLAVAYKEAKKGHSHITDIQKYAPYGNKPALFIASPIMNKGKQIGVFAWQIRLTELNKTMLETSGMGKTGETFIIGQDYYFRSKSRLYQQMGAKNIILNKKASSIAVKRGLSGKSGNIIIKGYRGVEVISAYNYIDLEDFKWAVLAQIDLSEALGPAYSLLYTIIIISIILIIAVIVLAVIIAKNLVNPILSGVKFARHIAGKDLTKDLETKYKERNDEIGMLSNALIDMKDNLITMVSDMNDISSLLAASSEENTASAQNLSDNAQNQAASIEETSASMEELNTTIISVAKNAENVNEKADALLMISSESKELIENAIESMDKISENSGTISDILTVINDIAEQTNLLALNASIEAARAGEHGRGFAVVADEIGKLADKSTQNAKEIDKLINLSIKDIKSGTEIVKNASKAFAEIIEGVNRNSEYVNEIVNSVNQQKAGSEQVQKAVEEINEITQSTSASAEQMAASTEELRNQAEKIQGMFEMFVLPDKNGKKALTLASEYQQKQIPNYNQRKNRTERSDNIVDWDQSYSVNIEQIDSQHKKWLDYINKLHKAMATGKSKDIIGDILKGLMEYTKVHLATEENLLKRHGYPDFEQHKAIHDKFVNWATEIYEKFNETGSSSVSIEVLDKMKNWLVNHIKTVDRKYQNYLNEKGIY